MPKRDAKADKPKNMRVSLKTFLKSIRRYRFLIILSVILTVVSAVLGLFIPKILGDMTTIAVNSYPDIDWGALSGKAILAIVLFLA